MSALDDIKSGSEKVVNMSKITNSRHKNTSPKTVINADNTPRRRSREILAPEDIIPKEEEYKEDLRESIEKEVLDLDNPDSAFSKYIQEKINDAAEYIAEKEEEQSVMNMGKDNPEEEDGVDYIEDYDATPVTQDYSNIEIITEDISGLKKAKKEEPTMPRELVLGTQNNRPSQQ